MPGRFTDLYVILIMLFIAGTAIVVAEGTGRITGKLVDDGSGKPIEAATVTIVGSKRGAVTDFNGRYTIGGLEPGVYNLVCSDPDYCTDTLKTVPVRSNTTTDASNRLLKHKTRQAAGKNGKEPVVPADIAVNGASRASDEPYWEAWCEIRNASGEVFVRGAGTIPIYLGVEVDACGDTIVATYNRRKEQFLCLLEGRVTDSETRKPIAGVKVTVAEGDSQVMTDEEGKFICRDLEPDCYTIEISHPDYETNRMTGAKVHSSSTRISCQLHRLNR